MESVNFDDWIGKVVRVLFMRREQDKEQRPAGCTRRAWTKGALCSATKTQRTSARGTTSSPGTESSGSIGQRSSGRGIQVLAGDSVTMPGHMVGDMLDPKKAFDPRNGVGTVYRSGIPIYKKILYFEGLSSWRTDEDCPA